MTDTNQKKLCGIVLILFTLLAMVILNGCAQTKFEYKPKDGKDGVSITGPKGDSGSVGATGAVGATGSTGAAGTPGLGSQKGLECSVYDSRSVDRSSGLLVILNNATPKFTKVINIFDIGDSVAANGFPKFTTAEQALVGTEDYALDCSGYIKIPVSGYYNFRVLSDDGSQLVINDTILTNMDRLQAPTYSPVTSKLLYRGLNKINILYFQGPLTQLALRLDFSGPLSSGFNTLQLVPSSILFN